MGHELILNGDIIDDPNINLKPEHQRILDHIERISYHQKVVWILGNHDNGYIRKRFGNVHFKDHYNIGNLLLIVHGYDFQSLMAKNLIFIKSLKLAHDLRVKIKAKPVHMVKYANYLKILYRILRDNVRRSAINCALENGYRAITCGHTHYPEERVVNGVRYFNTGAWTAFPASYLSVDGDKLTLKKIENTCYFL